MVQYQLSVDTDRLCGEVTLDTPEGTRVKGEMNRSRQPESEG